MREYLVWDTSRSIREAVRITAASGFEARRAYAESYGMAISNVLARVA